MLRGKELIRYLVRFYRDYGSNHGFRLNDVEIDERKISPEFLERLQEVRHVNLYKAPLERGCAGRISK